MASIIELENTMEFTPTTVEQIEFFNKDVKRSVDFISKKCKGDFDIAKYINNELMCDVYISKIGKTLYHITNHKFAVNIYVDCSIDNIAKVLVDKNCCSPKSGNELLFDMDEVVENTKSKINSILDFLSLYNSYTTNCIADDTYISRDDILKFMRTYPFVPITHVYCNSDWYYMDYSGYLRNSDHDIVDDFIGIIYSDAYRQNINDWNIHNKLKSWFRQRSQGCWKTGWRIAQFKNWYHIVLGDDRKFGDY